MMRLRSAAAGILLIVTLRGQTAIAFDLHRAEAELAGAKSCCATVGDLRTMPLNMDQSTDFVIDGNSEAFDFGNDDGLSFARAFQLPAVNRGYVLSIRSAIMTDNPIISTNAYIFYPVVMVLDDEKRVIRNTTLADLHYDEGGFARASVNIQISIEPSDQARYVVVHTPSSTVGKWYAFTVRKAVYPPLFQWLGQHETVGQTFLYRGSPVAENGELSIELKPGNS